MAQPEVTARLHPLRVARGLVARTLAHSGGLGRWLIPSRRAVRQLHVGCGPSHRPPGWWNIDVRWFPGVDEVMDATRPWPHHDLQAVFAEHFLEHLELDSAVDFLCHARAALVPGGVIRLSTPSLEWVMATHFDLDESDPGRRSSATFVANRAFHGWGHRFLWSKDLLVELLGRLGWEDLRFHAYGESDRPELAGLEGHGKYTVQKGYPSVWIVEATSAGLPPDREAVDTWLESEYLRYVRAGH